MKNLLAPTLILLCTLFNVNAQNPKDIKLVDYRPKSIYQIPITKVKKARYPAIDMHSHTYANSEAELAKWVKIMDEVGVEKTIIMTTATGPKFDSIYAKYAVYGDRFEVWCGFDYTGYTKSGWIEHAVKENFISSRLDKTNGYEKLIGSHIDFTLYFVQRQSSKSKRY